MLATSKALHEQRSYGRVSLGVGRLGLQVLREAGAAKARFPQGGNQAILINTGGGLAGGDDFAFDIRVGVGARLSVTSQAAERVYRTLGPPALVHTTATVEDGATMFWLPQETILFDGSALRRKLDVTLAASARFLAVEPVIFGRAEMGEVIARIEFHDRWRIRRQGKLIFADDVALSGPVPRSKATLGGSGAMATLLLAAAEAEALLERVREAIGGAGSASAWDGKLVARIVARDGFELRKALIPALWAITGADALPKAWTF
jgi:urease accessory protein